MYKSGSNKKIFTELLNKNNFKKEVFIMSNNNRESNFIESPIVYRLSDDKYKELGIPKVELIGDHEEVWAYARFDRTPGLTAKKQYMISNYARVYDLKNGHLLRSYGGNYEYTRRYRYRVVTFRYWHDGKRSITYLLHRLVALAFYPIDKNRPCVNHKDGRPDHNYLWNLEWVTHAENVQHAYRTGLLKHVPTNHLQGEKRSNSLWTDDEIKLICSMMEDGHKATYIFHELTEILKDPKVTYERVRTLYKHIIHQTHWTHISKNYNIDFRAKNYTKEKRSVEAAEKRKNEQQPETVLEFNTKAKDKNRVN